MLRAALEAHAMGRAVAIATVVSRQGSSPATPGQKLAIAPGDEAREASPLAVGTVGGGAVERAVITAMTDAIADSTTAPRVHTFRLGASLGMCCGGSAEILIEVLRPGLAVLLVGAGHVGVATARLLAGLEFAVTLIDGRTVATAPERVAELAKLGVRVENAEHDDPEVTSWLGVSPAAAACVVMTHDHQLDQRVIEWALASNFAFVGGVGSRAKAERTRQRLEAKNIDADARARVRMPVGLDIGARRPTEIALAIAAELVKLRSQREGLVRSAPRGDVHDEIAPADASSSLARVEDGETSSVVDASAREPQIERTR